MDTNEAESRQYTLSYLRYIALASGPKTRLTVVIDSLGNALESRLVWLDSERELEPLCEDVHNRITVRQRLDRCGIWFG